MMKKIFKLKSNEHGFTGLVETLVGSVIMFISLTATALVITQGLQTNIIANNHSRAVVILDTAMLKAKNVPYANLGVKITGGENSNVINPAGKDVTGCPPFETTFEGEPVVESTRGVDYCQVKTNADNGGTKFNVQTVVTEVNLAGAENDQQDSNTSEVSTFQAKRVSVIVSWYDNKKDAAKNPIMRQVQSEITITPKIGDCIPAPLGGTC